MRPSRFLCTGSLIAPDRVLTAGHCVTKAKVAKLRVRAGSPWSRGKRRGEQIRVRRARRAPNYNFRKDLRDLAVLTLRRPADAPVIEVADAREAKRATRPLRRARSAGFGTRSAYGFNLAARLKATREIVYPNRLCRRFYGKTGFDPTSMVCALGKVIRRYGRRAYPYRTTTCTGDSGGPLVAHTPRRPAPDRGHERRPRPLRRRRPEHLREGERGAAVHQEGGGAFEVGAAKRSEAQGRTRTGDPYITNVVLYQLSYLGATAIVGTGRAR